MWNGANDDLKVIKYAAADGMLVWDKTFAGAAGFNDYVFALAVDAAGNVIVAGEHQQSATDSDWKVIKYAAADGAILWQRDFAGSGAGLDIPYSVAIDAAGNAIVVGNTHNGTNFDARIVKYAAGNGATLWERIFAGAGGGDDMYYSVALDAAGNAYAAGFSFTASGGNDWTVARHAASDGTATWRRFVGGTANTSDVSVTIAIDADGNAVAAGASTTASIPPTATCMRGRSRHRTARRDGRTPMPEARAASIASSRSREAARPWCSPANRWRRDRRPDGES